MFIFVRSLFLSHGLVFYSNYNNRECFPGCCRLFSYFNYRFFSRFKSFLFNAFCNLMFSFPNCSFSRFNSRTCCSSSSIGFSSQCPRCIFYIEKKCCNLFDYNTFFTFLTDFIHRIFFFTICSNIPKFWSSVVQQLHFFHHKSLCILLLNIPVSVSIQSGDKETDLQL